MNDKINLTDQLVAAIIDGFLANKELKDRIVNHTTATLFSEFDKNEFKKEMMEKLYKEFKESIKKE